MGLKKCECDAMYGKAEDGIIHKHCSHCHSDSHWKEHTDWRTKDVRTNCPVLKKEKRERRAQINNNRSEKTFKKKTVAQLKELPWDMLKKVKEHRLNKVVVQSMSINFLKTWRDNLVVETLKNIPQPKKSKKNKKNKKNSTEVFLCEPEDKKFHEIDRDEPIQRNTTQAPAPLKLTRQMTGLWSDIAK